jgi:uncharacterized membrane protein
MASFSALAVRKKQIRLRHVVFAALLPMFLFVVWYSERYIFNHSDEEWTYFFPVRWLILPHGLAGLTALVAGPFQFSSRFRQRHLRLHRIIGRVCLASVAVAAVVAFYVSAIHQKQMQDREWIYALATAWLITGAIAFAAVRNGNIEAHRQWIARNYALTTVFVTVRVLNAIPIPDSYGSGPSWMLVLATLLFTEVGLSWHAVFTNAGRNRPRRQVVADTAEAPRGYR